MLYKSAMVTQASGSVGGMTASHNRGGMYMRGRSIPVNPNTAYQVQARAAFTEAVNRWTDTLTASQRAAWDLYAANVPTTNALGDTINISGQNWYVAANVPRIQLNAKFSAGIAIVDDGPTAFNRGDFTDVAPTWTETSGLSLVFDNTDAWANEDDAVMMLYEGRPQNASVNFFKGPWRLVAAILGDGTTAPTSPDVTSAALLTAFGYTVSQGQGISLAVAVSRADGRLSSRRIEGLNTVGA